MPSKSLIDFNTVPTPPSTSSSTPTTPHTSHVDHLSLQLQDVSIKQHSANENRKARTMTPLNPEEFAKQFGNDLLSFNTDLTATQQPQSAPPIRRDTKPTLPPKVNFIKILAADSL